MKRRQQEAQVTTEKRQQEAQAMAAKLRSKLLRSTRSAVPLGIIKHLLLLCIHVKIFEVHTVVVIRACTT